MIYNIYLIKLNLMFYLYSVEEPKENIHLFLSMRLSFGFWVPFAPKSLNYWDQLDLSRVQMGWQSDSLTDLLQQLLF